jgi:hypothetical protein
MTPIGEIVKNLAAGAGKGLLDGAKGIIQSFKADPTKVAEMDSEFKKLELEYEAKIATIENAADEIAAKQIESVNATMREESKSEHFLQWSWRPLVGLMFIAICINNYVVMPYLKNKGLQPIEVPSEVFMAILAILGVASWHRGVKKVKEVEKG